MTDVIQVREADQSIMKALPSSKVRKTAMYIMASDLGIPISFLDSEETALIATTAIMKALNMRITYGAIPGIHIHAVPRKSKVTDANGREKWVETYQIQDGEKLYKESMSRHAREGGFSWAFSDERMTRSDIEQHCKSIGYTDAVPGNAAGVWSCVKTTHHVQLGVEPLKVAGVWFGKVKQGYRWFDDHLPTGTNPIDVAMRRAHKRAIMASEYPLRPLSDEAPDVRAHEFVGEMMSRVEDKERSESFFVESPNRALEDDLDVVDGWFEDASGPVPNGNAPVEDNPFEDDAPESKTQPAEIDAEAAATIAKWRGPVDAQIWADEIGTYENEEYRKRAWVAVVKSCGGYSARNKAEVFLAWYSAVMDAAPVA